MSGLKLEKLIGREVNAFYCYECNMFGTMILGENLIRCPICHNNRDECTIEIKKYSEY